ncbi:MAG: tRNA uridine-5-carboxymethylaminomethyl(34) synthesis GTPase MnmE [Candidatus Aminicenantales bacterium]
MLNDTIIAISSPPGCGGLGIVRLSGPRSLAVAKRFFKPGKAPIVPGKPVFGTLREPGGKTAFDEAYLLYFKAPRSYTREDVVEITCHGSPVILEEVVRLGIAAGARNADPGEFTLRAYLNGRLDIMQAEAVNDLIRAVSLTQAKISFRQVGGGLSERVSSIRKQIVHVLSRIEAAIEFPDEGLKISRAGTSGKLDKLVEAIGGLIASYEAGRTLAEGITLAVSGRTNVGKSTIFNMLLDDERAIVTPYPGTTRDFLRERLVIKDAVFHLIDMAGLGRPSHPVEREGMRRGEKLARKADGVLLVFDASRPSSPEDARLLEKFKDKKKIIVFNKVDRPRRFEKTKLEGRLRGLPAVEISALKNLNIDLLKDKIYEMFVPGLKGDEDIVLHARQKLLLEEMSAAFDRACSLLKKGHPDEVIAEELRKALPLIGRLTGEIRAPEVMDEIFSRFCVGK